MHTLPGTTLTAIKERAQRTTNIAIAKVFLEKAVHHAEIEVWKQCVDRLLAEKAKISAEECRMKNVAKERWSNAERGSDVEYIWAKRYLELTDPQLLDAIVRCMNIDDALVGWKSAEKLEPAISVWFRKLSELKEGDARMRAENCQDFQDAAREYQNAEEGTLIQEIWFVRYITLRYH